MIEQLQKLKFGTGDNVKKGFVEGSEKLWLSVANAKIHNLIKGVDQQGSIAKQQKRVLKFVKTQVTPQRIRLFNDAKSEGALQARLERETQAKQALALEKLLLSLTLTMCVPGADVRDLTDTLEQIEDLMECFRQLDLDKIQPAASSKKKPKKEIAK